MQMNFREATDRLTECVTAADIGEEAGVTLNSISRARLAGDSPAHRSPPKDWEAAIVRIARRREAHFRRLADELEGRVGSASDSPERPWLSPREIAEAIDRAEKVEAEIARLIEVLRRSNIEEPR